MTEPVEQVSPLERFLRELAERVSEKLRARAAEAPPQETPLSPHIASDNQADFYDGGPDGRT